ncbi:MAG: DUF1259 domain-containing protein [Rhodococcus sp. (in: high G+C Gram-positive bacteria)]|nr:MAG: DUF1259 domain-containing protein [Rhodococcus sp. (in: high G+C Gram-positive bacteria)]
MGVRSVENRRSGAVGSGDPCGPSAFRPVGGDLDVVEVHNHILDEPLSLHFSSVGDSVTLATTMRAAISATHVTSGT